MKHLIHSLLTILLFTHSTQAVAFELKIHEVDISRRSVTEIPIANTLDSPIIIKITSPVGVQVFPRRFSLLPGERQVVKARQNAPILPDSKIAFSYVVKAEKKQGIHSRITLQLPVYEVSE